jgi:hypothetical protein
VILLPTIRDGHYDWIFMIKKRYIALRNVLFDISTMEKNSNWGGRAIATLIGNLWAGWNLYGNGDLP